MQAQKIALALAPLFLLAHADLQLDRDDVPTACTSICQPVIDLTRDCEVELRGNDNDRDENRLEAQCVCTNDSFDVSRITSLCADCMRQHVNDNKDDDDDDDDDDNDRDDGDLEDINDIMYTCGFASTTYASSASTAANSVTVVATAPTAISQLTTTIVPGATNTGTERQVTSTTTLATSASSSDTGSATAATVTTSVSSSDADDSGSSSTGTGTENAATSTSATDNAAPTLARVGAAGAAVVGAFMMLA